MRKESAKQFELTVSARTGREMSAYLQRQLKQAHALLKPPLREMSLALVGEATMSRLHEEFLGIAGPTDVITFELDHDARGRVTSGEVVVCVPVARRQAELRGIAARVETLLYALHGMLHLCGFDDKTESAFKQMHAKEDQILTRLGVGKAFSAAPKHASVSREN